MTAPAASPPAVADRPLRLLAIAGSLRARSYNRGLVRAAVELAPPGLEIVPHEIRDIPLYDGDLDADGVRPPAVDAFKAAIAAADGLLIATPEYNHSVPGVLQNALDWASRPAGRSPVAGKPAGIIGASAGAIGSARAQQQLESVLISMFAYVMPHAGVLVGTAGTKFDAEGNLTDAGTRQFLAGYLVKLDAWTRRMSHG